MNNGDVCDYSSMTKPTRKQIIEDAITRVVCGEVTPSRGTYIEVDETPDGETASIRAVAKHEQASGVPCEVCALGGLLLAHLGFAELGSTEWFGRTSCDAKRVRDTLSQFDREELDEVELAFMYADEDAPSGDERTRWYRNLISLGTTFRYRAGMQEREELVRDYLPPRSNATFGYLTLLLNMLNNERFDPTKPASLYDPVEYLKGKGLTQATIHRLLGDNYARLRNEGRARTPRPHEVRRHQPGRPLQRGAQARA